MRTLYQFPLSHFCEKARWLLDHKQLEYVAQNLTPLVHRAFAQLKTGQNKLPILKDDLHWIADSSQIALYLDQNYPEHTLLRADPQWRAQALQIDAMSVVLGAHVRRWVLAHTLHEGYASLDILIGEKGYLRQFERFSKPLLKKWMNKSYQVGSDRVTQSKQQMDEIIAELNQIIVQQRGRYLVGDRLGLADIAVCSMLGPILQIEGTPWESEQQIHCMDEFYAYQKQLLDLPLGQYVLRIYTTERNARVDWRGV